MQAMVRLVSESGGTAEPYLGRHRKAPPQIRAAWRRGKAMARPDKLAHLRLVDPLGAPEAEGAERVVVEPRPGIGLAGGTAETADRDGRPR